VKIDFKNSSLNTAENYQGQKLSYGGAKRLFPKIRWYLILIVVFTPIFYIIGSFVWETIGVVGDGYVRSEISTFTASVDGRIEYVKEHTDDILDSGENMITLNTQMGVTNSTNRLEKEMVSMKNSIRIAKEMVDVRKKEFYNATRLNKRGIISAPDLLFVQSKWIEAKYEASESEVRYYSYIRNEGIRAQSLDIFQFRKYTLGTSSKILATYVQRGEFVKKGTPLMVVQQAPAHYYFTIFLKPKFHQKVSVGQELTVVYPTGKKIEARVSKIEQIIQVPEEAKSTANLFLTDFRRLQLRLEPLSPLTELEQTIGTPVKTRFKLLRNSN
jgi:multidrug resistance efflux pump